MMDHEADDLMRRSLRRLPIVEPDDGRSQRVRTRCHAAIVRSRQRRERTARLAGYGRLVLEPALVGGLSLIYLVAVIRDVLRLRGIP